MDAYELLRGVDEEIDPLCHAGVRCAAVRQQCRAGLSARLDLVPVDGDDEITTSA